MSTSGNKCGRVASVTVGQCHYLTCKQAGKCMFPAAAAPQPLAKTPKKKRG